MTNSEIVSEYLWRGNIKSNFTNVTLVNNTAKTQDLTVPADKRWFIMGAGHMKNADNVARDCRVDIYESAGGNYVSALMPLIAVNAAQTVNVPYAVATAVSSPFSPFIPLLEGWVVRFSWAAGGASAGGTATIALIVLEIDS